ncbi:MAG TPA: zf-HC2 domain-containing protein [Candidatus Dormibacteraeota bacterium]|nr:zf-HC2 domain-containing protein [Candidatus Dormibacteraeota bacterium]
MPSEPRIPTEPLLEELSAYLDHELDASAQARVAEHVAGCQSCQARLDGLRQTANAVRALPMETPRRTFTIPAQRRQAWRWAPVGWVGSAAVALLVIAFGIQNLHLLAGSGSTATAGSSANYSARNPQRATGVRAASPLASPAASALDQQFNAQAGTAPVNASTVADPTNGSRRLVLDTDSASYSTNGKMRVTIQLEGSPSSSANSADQGLTLTLVHNGVGVALNPVGVISGNGTPIFGGWYELPSLPLSGPRAGDYRLTATWVVPDGSGRVLQAAVAVQLTGS